MKKTRPKRARFLAAICRAFLFPRQLLCRLGAIGFCAVMSVLSAQDRPMTS